jgi:hypothetical protein
MGNTEMTGFYTHDVTPFSAVIDSDLIREEIEFFQFLHDIRGFLHDIRGFLHDIRGSVRSYNDKEYLSALIALHEEASDNADDPDFYSLIRYSHAEEFAKNFCDQAYGLEGGEFIYEFINWNDVVERLMPVTIMFCGAQYRISP